MYHCVSAHGTQPRVSLISLFIRLSFFLDRNWLKWFMQTFQKTRVHTSGLLFWTCSVSHGVASELQVTQTTWRPTRTPPP